MVLVICSTKNTYIAVIQICIFHSAELAKTPRTNNNFYQCMWFIALLLLKKVLMEKYCQMVLNITLQDLFQFWERDIQNAQTFRRENKKRSCNIIGKVLFSSNLLFSKDYILLLKITLKWLLINQGKYVPLLIHLLAMQQSWEVLRSIRDILFEKVCENIAKNDYLGHLDHGSFWQLFFSDVDSLVSYSEVCHSNLSNTQSKTYIISTKVY